MTNILVHVLSSTRHKKVTRRRGTGKRRASFVFRRAKTPEFHNVVQMSIGLHSDTHFASPVEASVTFSYSNTDQCVARQYRDSKPVEIKTYQKEMIDQIVNGSQVSFGLPVGLSFTTPETVTLHPSTEEPAAHVDEQLASESTSCKDLMSMWLDHGKSRNRNSI